ncbi:MAG: hypothetical protein ABI882_02865 [Acidobacteriota bacterium]
MIHRGLRTSLRAASVVAALFCFGCLALAQSSLSDLKPSSVLFFNKYTSSPSSPQLQDTQINVTNVNPDQGISVHMFMVDGSTCSIADFYLGLSQNQTASFLASDFDPGVQGYIVAVAASGGPTQFNYLIGDEFIREQDGKLANLQAVGFAKISPGNVIGNGDGTASLVFNGIEYDQFPLILAASSFNSQVTHATNLALYSPMSNLMVGNPTSTTVFTLVYDDNEVPHSTTVRVPCYIQTPLLNFRIAGGSLNNIVPAGRTGWIKLNGINRPLLGAILTKGPVFNGGHNLHPISYLNTYTITVPDF